MEAEFSGSAEENRKYPQSLGSIRFITGCVLTIATAAISVGIAVWLRNKLLNLFPGNYFVFSLGVWLGTSLLFTFNFFRANVERAIVRDFEEMMLIRF